LQNFININNFNVLSPSKPTYWPSTIRKKPDILDIFVAKIPSNLHCFVNNILDLNSNNSLVLLSISATSLTRTEAPKLFYPSTNRFQFQNLVNEQVNLKIKLKPKLDIKLIE